MYDEDYRFNLEDFTAGSDLCVWLRHIWNPNTNLSVTETPLGRESMSVFLDDYHPAVPHLE